MAAATYRKGREGQPGHKGAVTARREGLGRAAQTQGQSPLIGKGRKGQPGHEGAVAAYRQGPNTRGRSPRMAEGRGRRKEGAIANGRNLTTPCDCGGKEK